MKRLSPTDISLAYEHDQYLGGWTDPYDRFIKEWNVTPYLMTESGGRGEVLGHISIYVVDFAQAAAGGQDVVDLMDSVTADLHNISAVILDLETGEIAPELESRLVGYGGSFLILDRAELSPDFRGMGLGPAIAGAAIAQLSGDCYFAACVPAPTEERQPEVPREVAIAALGRTWSQIGFDPFKDGVWILDVNHQEFEKSLARVLR